MISKYYGENQATNCPKVPKHLSVGATYLFDQICEKTGVIEDLKISFPDIYKQLLSLSYYLLLEPNSNYYRFEKWHLNNKHPYGQGITSVEADDILSKISSDSVNDFLSNQANRREGKEILFYEISVIPSITNLRYFVKSDQNSEDYLEPLHIIVLVDKNSGLPFFYKLLPGKITNLAILVDFIKPYNFLEDQKITYILDESFYSETNLKFLFSQNADFIISAPKNLHFLQQTLSTLEESWESTSKNFKDYESITMSKALQVQFPTIITDTEQELGFLKDLFLTININPIKYNLEKHTLVNKIDFIISSLINNNQLHEFLSSKLLKYIDTKKDNKNNLNLFSFNINQIHELTFNSSVLILLSNFESTKIDTLDLYRRREFIKSSFYNFCDFLKVNSLSLISDFPSEGILLISFIKSKVILWLLNNLYGTEILTKTPLLTLLDSLDNIKLIISDKN
ncbi:MAG: transposase, partial [Deltaproteobacteria bacterium]|nr:transposase [Deltaproteobacteria bacterium]